jgi:hypothetical protein
MRRQLTERIARSDGIGSSDPIRLESASDLVIR